MSYTPLNEINYNMTYAPLGFENEFKNRIVKEIINIIEKLDTSAPITHSRTNINNKLCDMNPKVLDYVISILNDFAGDGNSSYDIYRLGSNFEAMAYWNTPPKSADSPNHRQFMKDSFLNYPLRMSYINFVCFH